MRCVVKGYMQKAGKDFRAVYSPTAMISSIRIKLAVAVTKGWGIFELDVKNAYCHGIMDRECYIDLPPASHYPIQDTRAWAGEHWGSYAGCTVPTKEDACGSTDTRRS